ncbi:hypothetical protein MOD54_15640 [Bacillus spizizenii]|uniref:hypothetical protein n=1 Tax=Bacillus spizizenii TaxID=96241 RepID=UPI002280595E|nr:hypothetical protein [Bacillus spizizenii]MCY7831814.1 hypothetical protein [Bacillus spizizenii]MCY8058028.1 hypothetical protein [Bacillus spizizenii]MCY8253489.1 hypothetical protein [Bacillus spizizenii]MCY8306504.1 hypothetical protein [Bacillus spizizenii]MCY8326892.1 hypothetical protein [Bacillus spizizenii]
MSKIKASQVFTPGKVPNYTYNERKEKKLENDLQVELEFGGKIIVLSGPSKIGKTVLAKKCLPADKVIFIQPEELKGQILEEAIAALIEVPSNETKTVKTKDAVETNISAGAEFSIGKSFLQIFKAKFNSQAGIKEATQSENEVTQEYKKSLLKQTTKYLIENECILVFDDFHYLEPEEQTEIIHKLKPYILEDLHVCIILIPNRGEDVVKAERDMEARINNIGVPEWEEKELEFIPASGFEKLNIILEDSVIKSFIENSFKNPYLMQEICAHFCKEYRVLEQSDSQYKINLDPDDLKKIYSKLPHTNVTLLERLKKGKVTKGQKRNLYDMKDGSKLDLYEIILKGLAVVAHYEDIPIKSFVTVINGLCMPTEKDIHRSHVVYTLNKMVEICKESSPLEPALDYNPETEKIIMNDPFFRFGVRWQV